MTPEIVYLFEGIYIQSLLGLVIGSNYALMAVGLALIFGIMKIVNFAHGEFYMIGGYGSYFAATLIGTSPLIAVPVAILAGMGLGIAVERLLLKPIYTMPFERLTEYSIIITFGLLIFLQNVVILAFGPSWYRTPPYWDIGVTVGPLTIGGSRLFVLMGSVAILAAVLFYLRNTWSGRSILAVSQNRFGAEILGINLSRTSALGFAIGSSLAAAAGALLTPLFNVNPTVGTVPVVKTFIIVVMGGMGSIPGAVIGGLLLGVIEGVGIATFSASYRDIYGFIAMIIVLIIRPWGLFGERERWV